VKLLSALRAEENLSGNGCQLVLFDRVKRTESSRVGAPSYLVDIFIIRCAWFMR